MDRRDFLLFKGFNARARRRELALSCEWLYERCLDKHLPAPGNRDAAIFDEEAIRRVFDDLDDRLRQVDTVHVTKMDWLAGDLRKEFGNLMRSFRARGGRLVIDE